MTATVSADGVVALEGACALEDAEVLQQHLLARGDAIVDWRSCETAHTAVIQILLAARPRLQGVPAGEFLRQFVAPLLTAPRGG